jgi:hypothetical protein
MDKASDETDEFMNRTKSVAWTADCTPSGADFTTIK